MNIVVQMLIRNEGDVIYETLWEICRWGVNSIVILDGQSTDNTLKEIASFKRTRALPFIEVHSEPDPDGKFHDHIRNRLLELTLPHKPDWIISLDADEIYHTDPVAAILAAEEFGANVVRASVPEFWLTQSDLAAGKGKRCNSLQSIQDLRRWYSWGHMGTFIWKPLDGHCYPKGIPKRTPELPGKTWLEWQIPGPVIPICKHYCFRTLTQAEVRAKERRERGGPEYFGKYFYDYIVDERAAGLHYLGDDGVFNEERTHEKVHLAMRGTI